MTGIMMVSSSFKTPVVAADLKTWTGITSGLQFNLMNAPATGTTWTDDSGNGKHATLIGSPSYISTTGGGTRLNNSTYAGTDFVKVPYNIASSTVTVEMVGSWNPTSNWATIWGNDTYNSSAGYFAYMGTQTTMNWGKVPSAVSSTIVQSNNIRHWIWVINGNAYSLYLNGAIVGTTQTALTAQTVFTTNNFYFGARHVNGGTDTGTDVMNNSTLANRPVFYQLRVYNTAFSAANVTTNFNAVKSSVTGGYGL